MAIALILRSGLLLAASLACLCLRLRFGLDIVVFGSRGFVRSLLASGLLWRSRLVLILCRRLNSVGGRDLGGLPFLGPSLLSYWLLGLVLRFGGGFLL